MVKLSHQQWLERKERDMEDDKYEKSLEEQRRSRKESSRQKQSSERFDLWLLEKESFEKAQKMVRQLERSRCEDTEKWFEVAVSLNAVDCLRGAYKMDEYRGLPLDRDDSHNICSNEGLKERKLLETEFFRWSRALEHGHEFENVTCDPELGKTFTADAKEIMTEYAEQMGQKGDYIIPSLKYSAPNVKQAAHDKRNLFNPDKIKYNKIHTRLLRSEYARARVEMYDRLDARLDRARDLPLHIAEKKILSAMGLGRLARWLEEDEMEKSTIEQQKKSEDRDYARKIHESFVKKKESMKVRLPDPVEADPTKRIIANKENTTTRMHFAKGKPVAVRRKLNDGPASGSVDILMRSGKVLGKYLYCTNKKDLEMARAQLAKEGHVYKENFKDLDGDPLDDEYEQASGMETKRERSEQRTRDREAKASEKFQEWSTYKSLRSKSLDALQHIDKPGKSGRGVTTEEAHWRYVGEQLKAVDPTLLANFSEWSSGFKPPGQCKVLWETLSPTICDTCCPSSAVHATLLKFINRPGINYSDIFDFAVDNKLKRLMYSDDRDLSDATEEERLKVQESLELGPKAFQQMMLDAGIVLQAYELRILETLFDQDGNGKISRNEFLRFTGVDPRPAARGEALQILRGGNLCVWEACCHLTGMTNAYDIVPGNVPNDLDDEETIVGARPLYSRSGMVKEGWTRWPLPDLQKRLRKLIRSGDAKDLTEGPPSSCETSVWSNKERHVAVEALLSLAAKNREITASLAIKSNGEPPLAPVLTIGDVASLTYAERQTTLVFEWTPQEKSMFPAFYTLESCGKEGSKSHRAHQYDEICRDPPSVSSGEKQLGTFTVNDLQPGTKCLFRIRAFNGYGASPYTYITCATAPRAAPVPVVVKATPTTTTISWGGIGPDIKNTLRDMRDVFRALDVSGSVERDALLDVLEHTLDIKNVLAKIQSATIQGSSVLDMIETADDNIRWEELKSWMSTSIKAPSGKTKSFQYVLCRCVSDELVDFRNEGALKDNAQDTVYTVLKASEWFINRNDSHANPQFDLPSLYMIELPEDSANASEKPALKVVLDKVSSRKDAKPLGSFGKLVQPVSHLEVFEQVYIGSDTSCTLTGIDAGQSYQYRVFLVNNNDVPSRMSAALVTHAPAVAPPAPKLIDSVSTDSVTLGWGTPDLEKLRIKSKAKESNNRKRDDWLKLVGEWAQDPDREETGGVSESTLRKTFMRYDADANGSIEGQELEELFQDLGLPTEGPAFETARLALDGNDDGKVTYQEFSSWWKGSDMHFVLLHSVQTHGKRSPWAPVYRGTASEARVTGLDPNCKHVFALQCDMNRMSSAVSKEIVVVTAPETPQQPVVVEAGSKHIRVKWYCGHGGAERYVLEMLLLERLDGTSKRGSDDWRTVYDGKDTFVFIQGLQPNSVYRLRVKAINCEKNPSMASLPAQVVTTATSEKQMSKANAANYFEVESTGDLVVGDTVLFTERIFDTLVSKSNVKKSSKASVSLTRQSLSSLKDKPQGEFVSERTVAARIVASSHARDKRMLSMEVIWSSLSVKTASDKYLLQSGARIARSEADIFKFESFRAKWFHEDGRWTYNEERDAHFE